MRTTVVSSLVLFALCGLLLESEAAAEGMHMDATARAGLELMDSLGLKDTQVDVDRAMWEAMQATDDLQSEDDDIARLMSEMDGFGGDIDPMMLQMMQKQIDDANNKKDALKKIADDKAAAAEAAVANKAAQVDGAAAASEKTAEDLVAGTKELRAQAAAMMEEAKLASAAYQAALAAGQTDGLAELEAKAKQTLKQAQDLSRAAGLKSSAAEEALKTALEMKSKADQAKAMENESMNQLTAERVQWAGGPIFEKMQRLCDLDYPAFRKEYQLLRQSATYAKYRWDIKKACHKTADDHTLEQDWVDPNAHENDDPAAVHVDASKPYPQKNTHWRIPDSKKVKKWCSTKFGAVPCHMLEKAKEQGLLGDSDDVEGDSFMQADAGLDRAPDLVEVEVQGLE